MLSEKKLHAEAGSVLMLERKQKLDKLIENLDQAVADMSRDGKLESLNAVVVTRAFLTNLESILRIPDYFLVGPNQCALQWKFDDVELSAMFYSNYVMSWSGFVGKDVIQARCYLFDKNSPTNLDGTIKFLLLIPAQATLPKADVPIPPVKIATRPKAQPKPEEAAMGSALDAMWRDDFALRFVD